MRDNDIVERSSCPYTPEQNGCAERKHRHIVETYCALLSYSPKIFTNDFETVVFTFNRLPTQLFNNYFPFNNLLKTYPNYSRLHIFYAFIFHGYILTQNISYLVTPNVILFLVIVRFIRFISVLIPSRLNFVPLYMLFFCQNIFLIVVRDGVVPTSVADFYSTTVTI